MADIDEALVEKAESALTDALEQYPLTATDFIARAVLAAVLPDVQSAPVVDREALSEERERIARCLRNEAHGRNDAAFNRGVLFAARCVLARYDNHDAHSFCADPTTCPRCGCHVAGCVEHVEGMHVDSLGDAIVHVGCATCCPDAADVRRQVAEAVLALADEMENPNTEHGTMPGVRMQVRQHWAGRIRDAVERSDEEPCAEFGSHPRGAHARIAREVAP